VITLIEVQECHIPPEVLFEWVKDIQSYAQTIPGCQHSGVIEVISPVEEMAYLDIGFGIWHEKIITHNMYQPDKRIEIQLVSGPFKSLSGSWTFDPITDSKETTRVELSLNVEFHSWFLESLANFIITHHKGLILEFVERKIKSYEYQKTQYPTTY